MNEKEINQFIEQLRFFSKIKFPNYENPSVPEEGLIASGENLKIFFESGEIYNTYNKKLYLKNNEIFEGKIDIGEKYCLNSGLYKWPSGQKFSGDFISNNEYDGDIEFENGVIFTGKFNNNSEYEGKFTIGENKYIDGNFKKGKMNGMGKISKDNFYIEGNFNESKLDGNIIKFNITLNNHKYIFPSFNFKWNQITDDSLSIEKDGKNLILNTKKEFPTNRTQVDISDDEIKNLNTCINIFDNKIPEIEQPYISSKELIFERNNENDSIEFKNGIKAEFDDKADEYIIDFPNKEKFKGMLDDDGNDKYWLKEGQYIWPSGQEYNGAFNEKNEFESIDAELKMENVWSFKGIFQNGKLEGYGKFEWNGNNNYLDGYFKDRKLSGNFSLNWDNIEIKGFATDSFINVFEANFDNHSFKIQKIDTKNIPNYQEILFIEKDENEYFLVLYSINNNIRKIEKYRYVEQKEKDLFLKFLRNIDNEIKIPDFTPFSINNIELVPIKTFINENIIYFKNGISYNKETKILSLQNNENFKGVLNIDDNNKYNLGVGEYTWPSGQKYLGKFDENNKFEGNSKLIMENKWIYTGGFKNGLPNGEGEIKWENGNYIKGHFNNGKIFGLAYIKKNSNTFEGNYFSSIIKDSFNNIKIVNKNHSYNISKISIKKGFINEDYCDLVEENGNKIKIRLDNQNKRLLSDEDYKLFYFNENDLISLFKYISKIRKINMPFFFPLLISEEELKLNGNNCNIKKRIKLTFPNNDIFNGIIEEINGNYFLVEGEYEWSSGQKYIGKFFQNKLDAENGQLQLINGWTYKGSFKKGYIEGPGSFENKKGELIKGFFEKGEIKHEVIIKKDGYYFEGDFTESINKLYIKLLNGKIGDHTYEINEFKISDETIKVKRDGRDEEIFELNISLKLRIKIIESLLIKVKSNNQKFYYNEPYKKDFSNENKIKMLKIQDNIHSVQLSKLSIYCNRLNKKNRTTKGKIGKIIGVDIGEEISNNDLIEKLKKTYHINKIDKKNLQKKSGNLLTLNENKKNNNEIEFKEITKICNSKMLKEMKEEIYFINLDINTLQKEKEINKKEKKDKMKEFEELNIYYELLNNNYNKLRSDKIKIEEKEKKIEEDSKSFQEKNNHLMRYLNNLKNNWINNKNGMNKKIKDLENENNKLLKEIKEKEEIIINDNKEKEELTKTIKYLEGLIKKQK